MNKKLQDFLKINIDRCPKVMDLTNDEQAQLIYDLVQGILELGLSGSDLEQAETELIGQREERLISLLLAIKIVRSKLLARAIKKPLKISVVFAVYKEYNRIRPASEHPHGEDFLVKKVEQLRWLFDDNKQITWELIVVDDGCPGGSGRIAEEIIAAQGIKDQVKVLYLADAIKQGLPPASGLTSTDQSQKGGSIVYGMWEAAQERSKDDHVIIFTDADLSTHLGQLMLLAEPLLHQNKLVAIGSRREPSSVVVKEGVRNNRGKLFIYLWKRMIPNLSDVVDTQCGFKGFRAELVPEIIEDMVERKFAFDIELLLRSVLYRKGCLAKVPVAWIDSEAASTTTDIQPYLPMLKSIVQMSRKYLDPDETATSFGNFIESLDTEEFNELIEKIPAGILEREPREFDTYDRIGVTDLAS